MYICRYRCRQCLSSPFFIPLLPIPLLSGADVSAVSHFPPLPHSSPSHSVVPHLKGLNDYNLMAVLGRGHFGKVKGLVISFHLPTSTHPHHTYLPYLHPPSTHPPPTSLHLPPSTHPHHTYHHFIFPFTHNHTPYCLWTPLVPCQPLPLLPR